MPKTEPVKTNLIIQASKTYGKYKKKEEVWRSLGAIMTLTTTIFLGFFAIWPTIKAITGLLAEIENREELSSAMKSKIDQTISAQTVYANVQQELFLLDQYFPKTPQMALGITQLIAIAQKNNLEIGQISFGKFDFVKMVGGEKKEQVEMQKESLGAISFSLEAKGSYQETKNFLSSVYQARRAIEISSYQFAAEEEETEEKLKLQLNGKLLFYREEP